MQAEQARGGGQDVGEPMEYAQLQVRVYRTFSAANDLPWHMKFFTLET